VQWSQRGLVAEAEGTGKKRKKRRNLDLYNGPEEELDSKSRGQELNEAFRRKEKNKEEEGE